MSNQHVDDYTPEPRPATESNLRILTTRVAARSSSTRVLLNHIEYLKRAGTAKPSPEEVAAFFHSEYERLAVEYGYETKKGTAIPWEAIPEDSPNKRLMIAVAASVLGRFA